MQLQQWVSPSKHDGFRARLFSRPRGFAVSVSLRYPSEITMFSDLGIPWWISRESIVFRCMNYTCSSAVLYSLFRRKVLRRTTELCKEWHEALSSWEYCELISRKSKAGLHHPILDSIDRSIEMHIYTVKTDKTTMRQQIHLTIFLERNAPHIILHTNLPLPPLLHSHISQPVQPRKPSSALAPGSLQTYLVSCLSVKPLKRVAEHLV